MSNEHDRSRQNPRPAAAAVAIGGPQAPGVRTRPLAGVAPKIEGIKKRKKRKKGPEFFPLEPRNWQECGIDPSVIEGILLRYLLGVASESGRGLAEFVCLPLGMVRDVVEDAKNRKLLNYRSTTVMGDFVCELTEAGRRKALDSRKLINYVGPAPVPFEHYLQALDYQSLSRIKPGPAELKSAFADIYVSDDMLERLGPAVTSCRPMFLHGEPGNGKTSLAERMTRCFGSAIWIPSALDIGGHLVNLFDPALHHELPLDPKIHQGRTDRRWIRIERPTVIVGGELTLDMLEFKHDKNTNIIEAPLQMKSNCGTLLVDDFGRGNTKPKDLLNRWIFPLEKGHDFLTLPDGRKISVPFDSLLVFSTNLEPSDLADEAFLRRIPYKLYVGDPLEEEFAMLTTKVAEKLGVRLPPRSVRYLLDRHYKLPKRAMRMCHPRDLLLQIVHMCEYEGRPPVAGPQEWDRVVGNYFGA